MRERELSLAGLSTVAVGEPSASRLVIVLHGFAMDAGDLSPFAHSLGVDALFLFPRAPLPAEPAPGVHRGFAWWHIDPVARTQALARGPRDFVDEHPEGLPRARRLVEELVSESRALAPNLAGAPLTLAGFSQGGMLACDTFLRAELGLAGLALFSASRIAFDEWQPFLTGKSSARAFPPLLISHGERDDDLAFSAGERLRDCLSEAGAAPTFVSFPEGHAIPLLVWRAFRKFLLRLG